MSYISPFFDFDGVTYNRNAIKAISGPSLNDGNLGGKPFIRVVLDANVEWHLMADTFEDVMVKRAAFIAALNS